MKLTFDTRGNEKQKECVKAWIDNTVSDIAYGGSKGSAKSYTGCSLIFGDAFIYPETHYFIARKKLTDIRKFTIPSIHEVFQHWGLGPEYWRYNGQDNFFELHNKSKVFLMEAKYMPSDPHYYRFGSMQMTRGWIEEAGEFEHEAAMNLMASVGRWKNDVYGINGKVLQTCNPTKNYLYRLYYKMHKEGTIESWKRFIQALPQDNKMLPAGYLENLNRILGANEKKRLLHGDWEYDDNPNALCDYESILAIFSNDHIKPTGKKYITADVARFGSDTAKVVVWDDWVVIEYHEFEISKTTDIQACINAMRSKHNIPKHYCIADDDGIGGGVVDNCGIKGFVNNASPIDEGLKDKKKDNFKNLQAQCVIYFSDVVNDHEIYFKAPVSEKTKEQIIEELETIESFKTEVDGPVRVIPKEKVKEKIGRSPDWRDVLMMRYFFELKPVSTGPKSFVTRRN